MSAIVAIARATIPMLARQRLLLVPIIAVALSLLALAGLLLVDDGPAEIARAEAELSALTTGFGIAIGATVYALIVGASLISREIADGTLLMLAVRPVARWQIIAGRLLGAATFFVASMFVVAAIYGLVASVFAGTFSAFDEPFHGLVLGLPAVLLALCVGTAFSIQGRATAAIGSAIGVALFATVIAGYVDGWERERHLRGYLTDEVTSRIDANDPIVGPAASLVVRFMPFGVFGERASDEFERRALRLDDLAGVAHSERERIDTHQGGVLAYMAPAAASPTDPAAAGTTPPIAIDPADPDVARELPPEPTQEAFNCASYGGAACFLGFRDAWTQRYVPEARGLHEGLGFWLALAAIPAWVLVAGVLLTRRRDLA